MKTKPNLKQNLKALEERREHVLAEAKKEGVYILGLEKELADLNVQIYQIKKDKSNEGK